MDVSPWVHGLGTGRREEAANTDGARVRVAGFKDGLSILSPKLCSFLLKVAVRLPADFAAPRPPTKDQLPARPLQQFRAHPSSFSSAPKSPQEAPKYTTP